ncbi:MAG: MmgE/PrpD family protein [Betaproteobacteria bacterium]
MNAGTAQARASLTGELLRLLERPIAQADRERAALHLLDWLGCAFVGRSAPAAQALGRWGQAGAPGSCSTWGVGRRDAAVAALVNGGLGNLLELDDLHRQSIVHPGDTVVPAALALAEREGASAQALLDALLRGYEVAIRIGIAAGPGHYRYWYSTATCGVFGAAAACAHLLALDTERSLDALGQAGMMAAGLWQCRQEPTFSKQLASGRAAQSGLLAAELAATGFAGARQILEGSHGFFAATCEQPDVSAVLAGAEGPWKIHEVSFKPWSACRHVHPAIEAALALRASGLDLQQVQSLNVYTYADAIAFADCPLPQTAHQARFSLQHAVSVALLRGDMDLQDSAPEALAHDPIARLRQRVQVQEDPLYTRAYPERYGARLVARMAAGGERVIEVQTAKGDPENPMSQAELQAKALRLMQAAGLPEASSLHIARSALALAHGGSLHDLRAALEQALV